MMIFSIALLAALSLQTQEVKYDCTVEVRPVWNEARSLITRLSDDAFVSVLDIYIKDLQSLVEKHESWISRANSLAAQCEGSSIPARIAALNGELDPMERLLASAMERGQSMFKPETVEPLFRRFAQHTRGSSDCGSLALLLGALGRHVDGNVPSLIDAAGKVLSDGVSLRVLGVGLPVVSKSHLDYIRFGQTGFKQPYIDLDPSSANQVRHFIGYFVAGASSRLTSSRLLEALADYRDHNQLADYSLGLVAGNLGFQVAADPSRLRSLEGIVRGAACK